MIHWNKRLSAAGLALSLLLGQAALASDALGHDLHTGTAVLSEGTTATRSYFWSDTYNDLRTERYVTYTPNEAVNPTVAYGDTVLTRATLSAMARTLEAEGKRVVGGTNGDFYVLTTGQPLGMVVTDGVVRSSSSYHSAIGFRSDGTAFVGTPNLYVSAVMLGERVTVFGGVNKVRQVRSADGGGLTLLTPDFGKTTQNTSPGVDVFLRVLTVEEAIDARQPQTAPQPEPEPVSTAGPEDANDLPEGEEDEDSEGAAAPAPEGDSTPAPAETPVSLPLREMDPEDPVLLAEETGLGRALTLSEELKIGGRVSCVVDYVSEAAGSNPIPEGCFVLTMNARDDEGTLNMLRSLQPGDRVDIDITSEDTRWEEATEALGAMYRLLDNGQLGPNLSAERTARTAIGIKADGTVLFYTVDGKQPGHSIGASCAQVAQRLLELGCVEAVGLDGGGSTTMGFTTPAQEVMAVVNRPSDGSERKNSTAIFLTTELKATGVPACLQVEPGDAILLAGASLPLEAYQVDTGYRLMGKAENVRYEAEGEGTVEGDTFTAGKTGGTTILTAAQGRLTGTASITTVRTPDEIVVTNEATGARVSTLALDPGQQVSLAAAASWRNLLLMSQDGCYTWACSEEAGTIDHEGTFTAADKTSEGEITVTAGDKTVTIPVNVTGHILPLEDFEGEESPFASTDTIEGTLTDDLAHVRMGGQSLQLDYETGEDGFAALTADLDLTAGEKYLGLWVYGDGSGHEMTILFDMPNAAPAQPAPGEELEEGEEDSKPPIPAPDTVILDFEGWRHLLLPIPAGAKKVTGLRLTSSEGKAAGILWLDHLTTANEAVEDATAPSIDMKLADGVLTATVSDNVDRSFADGDVTAAYDGWPLEASWNAATGVLTARLPQPEPVPEGEEAEPAARSAHRVTVTVADVSGNLARSSLDIPGDTTVAFADMEGHWALGYASYLYEQGVTRGVSDGEVLYYQPNANITRAEFFTMAARWMGLDLTEYEGAELPFADGGAVPAWAVPAVAAMYDRGIVKGSLDFGVLYLYPNTGISRAEVMTILGRTQPRGYPEAELESFTDHADVASWSAIYVQSLVGQKIINGYEDGTLKPNNPMTRGEVAKVLTMLK